MDSPTPLAEDSPPDDAHTYRMPPARLSLTPKAGHGPLDGAWWPRYDALELGVARPRGLAGPRHGTVTRVTVAAAAWPDAPLTVSSPDQVIEVVLSDATDEEHAITLECGTVRRWELPVIPPGEPADTAERLLSAAADPWNPLSARRTLTRAEGDFGSKSAGERYGS